MTDKQLLYDELCRVLTDYEGNGSMKGAMANDLYEMLTKIQNNWEDVITSSEDGFVPSAKPRCILSDWFVGTGPYEYKAKDITIR